MAQSGNLIKAKLTSLDGVPPIEFMFNPTELAFQGIVETAENSGARTEDKGQPKVSYSHVIANKITINRIVYDTYEDGTDVVDKYINPIKKALEFVSGKERPPIYTFNWGSREYFRRCFLERLDYKLTMFLPDGTPVRALIESLTLKEADDPKPNAPINTPNPEATDRQNDSIQNRTNASSSQGNQGSQGSQGNQGNQANQGRTGNQANQGRTGNQGNQGNQGRSRKKK